MPWPVVEANRITIEEMTGTFLSISLRIFHLLDINKIYHVLAKAEL
jgi:hypothetical protein